MAARVYAQDKNSDFWYKEITGMLVEFDKLYKDYDTSFNLDAEIKHLERIMLEEDETEAQKTKRLYDYYKDLLREKETWDSEVEDSIASRRRGGFVQPKRKYRIGTMK